MIEKIHNFVLRLQNEDIVTVANVNATKDGAGLRVAAAGI